MSSGPAIQPRTSEPERSVGFWQKVGAFLSPSFLRYAVPALALFAVVAVGFVVVRQPRESSLVARNEPLQPAQRISEEKTEAPPENFSGNTGQVVVPDQTQTTRDSNTAGADKRAQAGEEKVSPPATARPADDAVAVTPQKDAENKQVSAAPQPTFAPEPEAGARSRPQPGHADVAGDVAQRQEKPAERDAAREQEREGAGQKVEDRQSNQTLAKARVSSPASGRGSTLESASGLKSDSKRADYASETRTVSGRRFRRQDDAWVDVSYQTSFSLTVVKRGTEQYRALIADEPGIRVIAEQLAGEIVLMWKGRAYRIR